MRRLRRAAGLLAALTILGCAAPARRPARTQRAPAIERVAVGDTMADVRRALGEPGGVALDATPDGRERVIWYYAKAAASAQLSRVTFVDGCVADVQPP